MPYQVIKDVYKGTNVINLTELVNYVYLNSGDTLYGFRLKSTPVLFGIYKAFRFLSNVPTPLSITGIKKISINVPIASKNFVYDEINNNVYDNTLLNYHNNLPFYFKETTNSDPFGLVRQAKVNDSLKIRNNYNYLFNKVIESDNTIGMVDTTSYDYMGRPIKISHNDSTYFTIEYITESGNILAGNGTTTVSFLNNFNNR